MSSNWAVKDNWAMAVTPADMGVPSIMGGSLGVDSILYFFLEKE